MEQAVWFYVGVIVALLGLGLLVSVVNMSAETSKQQLAGNMANNLALQCNNVCGSDFETVLGIKSEIGSGSIIESEGSVICVNYKGKKECRKCDCKIKGFDGNSFRLDLSTEEAIKTFDTHEYNCTFERDVNGVILRCKG